MFAVAIVLCTFWAIIMMFLFLRNEWVWKIRLKVIHKERNLYQYLPSSEEMIYKYFTHWSYDYFINLAQQRKVQHDKKRTGK